MVKTKSFYLSFDNRPRLEEGKRPCKSILRYISMINESKHLQKYSYKNIHSSSKLETTLLSRQVNGVSAMNEFHG